MTGKENEQSEFDFKESDRLRDIGITRAETNTEEDWHEAAMAAVATVARRLSRFTTDDVVKILIEHRWSAREPRALGGIMRRAQKLGYCEPTSEYVKSPWKRAHSRPKRVWRSTI